MNKEEKRKDLSQELDQLADEEDLNIDEDLKEFTENNDLDPEYQIDPQEKQMLDDAQKKVVENKIKSIINAEKYKREMEKNRKTGYDFHALYSAVTGALLTMTGFLYSGVFITIYILGLLYILATNIKALPQKEGRFAKLASNHPTYYLLAGVVVTLLFVGAGHQVPEIEGFIRATIYSIP